MVRLNKQVFDRKVTEICSLYDQGLERNMGVITKIRQLLKLIDLRPWDNPGYWQVKFSTKICASNYKLHVHGKCKNIAYGTKIFNILSYTINFNCIIRKSKNV